MSSSADRVRRHREALRAAGLRPVQLWVPDTRDPAFVAACRRQSLSLLGDPQEEEVLAWLEVVADRDGWQ
ncbi:MAG: antitoxin MazE family protein [Burkholderiaceae bacterium]|nr:antitoxin MazE family protein [Burkholderiaceae bacterium]